MKKDTWRRCIESLVHLSLTFLMVASVHLSVLMVSFLRKSLYILLRTPLAASCGRSLVSMTTLNVQLIARSEQYSSVVMQRCIACLRNTIPATGHTPICFGGIWHPLSISPYRLRYLRRLPLFLAVNIVRK